MDITGYAIFHPARDGDGVDHSQRATEQEAQALAAEFEPGEALIIPIVNVQVVTVAD